MTAQRCTPGPLPADDPPWWRVTAVFDPGGTGQDFAYTTGLHEHGLPELHVSARPPEGEDPGADWRLSPRDCSITLDAAARRLVGGDLRPGDTWTDPMDGGATLMHVVVGDPVGPGEVDASGVDPGAVVLPLRWSLHRPAPGPRRQLSGAEVARVRRHASELLHGRATSVAGRGLGAPGHVGHRLSVAADQPFGPRHAAVVARAAQMAGADHLLWIQALYRAVGVRRLAGRTVPGAARAAARPVGLADAVEAVDEWAGDVATGLIGRGRATSRWRGVLDILAPGSGRTARHRREVLEMLVVNLIRDVLAAEVLGDDADLDLQRQALGAWVVPSTDRLGGVDPRWLAPAETLEAVGPWCGEHLLAVAGGYSDDVRHPDTADLLMTGHALACLGGVAIPPLDVMLRGTTLGHLLIDQPLLAGSALAGLAQAIVSRECFPDAFGPALDARLASWGVPAVVSAADPQDGDVSGGTSPSAERPAGCPASPSPRSPTRWPAARRWERHR